MSYTRGRIKIEWEYIGEGNCGEYDENDETDRPLLRFTILKHVKNTKGWEQIDDASYCTCIETSTKKVTLKKLLRYIYNEVADQIRSGHSIKKICERLSWVTPSMVEV